MIMNLWRKLKRNCFILYFTIKSLSYNASRPKHHYLDLAFEPLFWFVDNFTAYIGVLFVIAVTLLTTAVVVMWYIFLRPVILTYSLPWMIYHFFVAHYLLVNIVFHYFKAVSTNPGVPPQHAPMESIPAAVVCKKCIQPKPPRTHHCSICNKCYLKMDHHCPWMNNCIGFYNHRYFVSFCVFMWLGTVYVSMSSYDLFVYHFYHPGTILSAPKRAVSFSFTFGLGPMLEKLLGKISINGSSIFDAVEEQTKNYRQHPGGFEIVSDWEHVGVIYLFLLCSAVTVALALLNVWHFVLIARGETSIEVHVNSSERKKAAMRGMGYNNPYNYNGKQNFRILLGLDNRNRSLFSILLPSSHLPGGDGMRWPDNKKPVHYPDPHAYERYEKTKNLKWRKYFPC